MNLAGKLIEDVAPPTPYVLDPKFGFFKPSFWSMTLGGGGAPPTTRILLRNQWPRAREYPPVLGMTGSIVGGGRGGCATRAGRPEFPEMHVQSYIFEFLRSEVASAHRMQKSKMFG